MNVGDIVKIPKGMLFNLEGNGYMYGVIVCTEHLMGVEFPEFRYGHNCDGAANSPHGWFVGEEDLTLVEEA